MSYDICAKRWGTCPSSEDFNRGDTTQPHICAHLPWHKGPCKCSWCGDRRMTTRHRTPEQKASRKRRSRTNAKAAT